MKKHLLLLLAMYGTSFCASPSRKEVTFLDSCRLHVAKGIMTLIPTVIEMAATTLTLEGDPEAAKILYDIQMNKTPQALFCEAGSADALTMFDSLVQSLNVTEPIRAAILNALYAAFYKLFDVGASYIKGA